MTISHAGAVAFRDNIEGQRVYLVITSSDGAHWVLPKGHIEAHETAEQAAVRELKEEAGVIGEVVKPLSVKAFQRNGESYSVQYFLIRTMEIRDADELRIVRWEDEQTAFDLLTFQEAREALGEGAAQKN
jgi:8-oxo-dGTP pyrophosphatase MutT (NUDIX family)